MQWTVARRKKQANLIRKAQPWKSGGVKTLEGKQITRYNALKHGARGAEMMQYKRLLTRCDRILSEIQHLIILSAVNDDYAEFGSSPVGR
jgi:hypothetical protein